MKKQKKTSTDLTVKLAEELIQYAIAGKNADGVIKRYQLSLMYEDGQHAIRTRGRQGMDRVMNKYAEIFETRIAHITEALPKFDFKPQEEADIFTADALNQIIGDIIWAEAKMNKLGRRSVHESAHAGTGIFKTNVNRINGHPIASLLSCQQFFPDPLSVDMDDARFCCHAYPMYVGKIKSLYGVEVSPESFNVRKNNTYQYLKSYEVSTGSPNTMPTNVGNSVYGEPIDTSPKEIGQALVWEIWLEDLSREKIPYDKKETDDENEKLRVQLIGVSPEQNHVEHIKAHKKYIDSIDQNETDAINNILNHIKFHFQYPQEQTRRKYPNGRVIIISQGKKLDDIKNPLPISWRNVFVTWNYHDRVNKFWGKGLGVDLIDPQDVLNHRYNSITKSINIVNNPIMKVKRNAININKNLSKFNNILGKVIALDNPNDLIRDTGPALPAHFFNEIIAITNFMEKKGGDEALQRGSLPAGSPAGVTVSTLLNQAQKPINSVVSRYADALKKIARNFIAIMAEFADPNEMYRIINNENEVKNVKWSDLKDQAGMLDIRIDLVGQLETSRSKKLETALKLKQFNVYDNQAVLESIDDPNKYNVIQRQSEILQLQSAVKYLKQQVDLRDKQINTIMNRNQDKDGKESRNGGTEKASNAGVLPSVRDKR